MTREILYEKINELNELNGNAFGFFVSWASAKNITVNSHGPYSELNDILDQMESSPTCIEGELPFSKLVLYFNYHAVILTENELWDCVDDPSEDSHVLLSVPYLNKDGDWMYLDKNESVYVITDKWSDFERHYEFVGVYGDERKANQEALAMANNTYGHHFEVTKVELK